MTTNGLRSKIIGHIDLDQERLAPDLAYIEGLPGDPEYTAYSFGTWNIHILWNETGDENDSILYEYDGPGQITAIGDHIPYIKSLMETYFRLDRLKWARVFMLRDGHIIPHRDYLEFERSLTRIHVALSTDSGSLHSEGGLVFQMRPGEVWFLAAEEVHAAASLNDYPRIVLCVEFDLEPGAAPATAFRDPDTAANPATPKLVERPPQTEEELQAIHNLGPALNEQSYRDVVQRLSRIHFEREVTASAVFDWLIEISRSSADSSTLVARSVELKRNCIERREMYESISR